MENKFKDILKKVPVPNAIQNAIKPITADQGGIKNAKKELEEKKSEKSKTYGFIGMEVYDLVKAGKISIPQINSFITKMDELDTSIAELEEKVQAQKNKPAGKNICSCGYKLKPHDKFCPKCGEPVQSDKVVCTCGTVFDDDLGFCRSCGKSRADVLKEQEQLHMPVKECICGAKIMPGQFMCLECGRKVE